MKLYQHTRGARLTEIQARGKAAWKAAIGICMAAFLVLLADAFAEKPVYVEVFNAVTPLDTALVSLVETQEQISRYAIEYPGEDRELLDETVRRIFGAEKPPLTEESVLKVLSYVAHTLKLGPSAPIAIPKTGTAALRNDTNLCGGFAIAFSAICRRLGFPARNVMLENLEVSATHVCAEVVYGNAWRFFDPTFGTFFYTNPTYDGKGAVLSFRDLLYRPDWVNNCFQAGGRELWSGEYKDADVQPMPRDFNVSERQAISVRDFYHLSFQQSFPNPNNPFKSQSFPVDVDLTEKEEVWFGKVDQNGGELAIRAKDDADRSSTTDFHRRNEGIQYIGIGDGCVAYNTFLFKVKEPGRYRITYHFAREYREWWNKLDVAELRNIVAWATSRTPTTWSVDCRIQGTDAILQVVAIRGGFAVDAIHVQRLDSAKK